MDFDEYDYLEKTVETADALKVSNGSAPKSRSGEKRRSGEDADDGEDGHSRSRRHRSGDGGDRDRPERDERERSHREKSRDRERDRDRDRDRYDRPHRDRNYRESDKDYRDGERKYRSKESDRDRDHEREREKEAEPVIHKERSQSRSRDHDRYDRVRSRDVDRDNRYPREKREKKDDQAAEPEADPERDQRTVFAFQISLKADEKDVYDFFSRAGKVRDVRLIMDRNTRRSKGVGYIEFYDAMSVPMAIALTGQPLFGQPVMVKPSEAEKNLVPSTSSAAAGVGAMGQYSGSARRLYVGNLHFNIGEEQLRQVFEPFGLIELVQLPIDSDTDLSKGYGFVQYARLEDARSAQAALNGNLELAGRLIKVVPMTDQNSGTDSVLASGELDDDDGGLSLTARSRALLMQKLDRSGTVASVQNIASTAAQVPPALNVLGAATIPAVQPILPGLGIPGMVGLQNAGLGAIGGVVAEPIGVPTECLLLKNMFDPSTETEPDFDLDIKDEVVQECSKYGVVKHVYVDKNSLGHVYLRFNNMTSSMNTQRALHGRWFAGKMITTTYMTPQAYEAKFPDSKV